jgi:hypothetical protein
MLLSAFLVLEVLKRVLSYFFCRARLGQLLSVITSWVRQERRLSFTHRLSFSLMPLSALKSWRTGMV